ncbi:hypothetical protein [Acrocarpospora sp. B8E8]|uniref:hypothetical protein n=1 Tax=Acrocarpospora sp. B8E8 TaxID=3153572 RepID=UPI00325FD06D
MIRDAKPVPHRGLGQIEVLGHLPDQTVTPLAQLGDLIEGALSKGSGTEAGEARIKINAQVRESSLTWAFV